MFGTYVMYFDMERGGDDDYEDGEYSNKNYYK